MNSLWILLFISLCSVIKCVYIEENGYKDITISFSENSLNEPGFDFLKLKDILSNASDILFHATRNRSYFEDFTIVVPSTFTKVDVCDKFVQTAPKNIDIYVTDSSYISFLRAQHSRGCGEKGEIIYLPKDWMAGNTKELALQFVQQWSIFRYGVFPENPERPGSCIASIWAPTEVWLPTGCYNIDLDMDVQFDENGLPSCDLPSDFREREDVNSSIMFSASNSTKVLNFCDGSESFPHNPVAPTLHNRICNGKSVWSVIKGTEDFKYGRNSSVGDANVPKKPTFRCFKESKTHLTIMIQDTDSEARSEIRYALLYFFTIIEPATFSVTLATFSSESSTNEKDFTSINLENTKTLKSLLESRVKLNEKVSDVCLTCGLRKAYKVSETSQYSPRIVVSIARESSLENAKISEMTDIMQKYPNTVLHILFIVDTPDDIIPSSLVEAMQKNRGRIFRLKNEPVLMLSELTTALIGVSKNVLHIEEKVLVVHKKTYENVTSDITDVFLTPKNTKGKLFYSMQFKKRGDIKNVDDKCTDMDIDLQSPICGNQTDINVDTEAGKIWRYSFRYVAGSEGTTCSSLALLKLEPSSKSSFTVNGWLSENKITPGQNALIIYAEVYNKMEQEIKVEARISGPGLEDFPLELRDNGNGDPDIIKGDNIYSRYFTSFSKKGTYTVTIVAEALDQENKKVNDKDNSTEIERKITQTKIIGTFRVMQARPKEDILPPNRVCDLEVISINHANKTVLLQWTAPGDDFDYGKATKYKIYFTEDWKDLEEDMFGKIPIRTFNTSKMEPRANGCTEIQMFQVPKVSSPTIYFIVLKASDKNGNEGKISNTVQVVIYNLLINNLTQRNDTENSTKIVINDHKNDTELLYSKIYIISGSIFGIIFLIIIINILIWFLCFRKYKRNHHAAKVKDDYNDKIGNNLNSDENILQSENSRIKALAENQETIHQKANSNHPMLMYAEIQKRSKNQEPASTISTNENSKSQDMSHHKEYDLGFV